MYKFMKNRRIEKMAKQNFRALGMDTMERLYYERKDCRKKAYNARKQRRDVPQHRMRHVMACQMDGTDTSHVSMQL